MGEEEEQRLAALLRYGVLDTAPERAFDEIVEAAARLCGAPIAAVSLVDRDRQWFKAKVGFDVSQTPRDISFCTHAMRGDDISVVPDASAHPLFATNPLVLDDPQIRFYAGAPIRTAEGLPLGTLCVIDRTARPEGLAEEHGVALKVLARQVEAQLELRRLMKELDVAARRQALDFAATRERESKLLTAFDSAEIGWWEWDVAQDRVTGNLVLAELFRMPAAVARAGASLEHFFANIHPADRGWVGEAVADAVATGVPFREEYRLTSPDGSVRWVSARGQCAYDEDGAPIRFAGAAIDITEQRTAEDALREANLGRELAMSAARLGRFDHSPSRGVRFYDERALEMVGMTLEEIQAVGAVLDHIHPEDRPRVAEALAASMDPKRAGPFRQAYRVVHPRTGEVRWLNAIGRSHFVDGVCTRFTGVFEDVTEAKLAEQQRRMLINELNHRVKNSMAVVASLVDTSLRALPEVKEVRRVISERITAYGRAHDLLTADSWHGAGVCEIVEEVVASLSLPRRRIEATGRPVRLGPQPALQLALALNELATNSLKYGALSNEVGTVSLTWGANADEAAPVFHIEWLERGGPPVEPPTRRGFGSVLIERATAAAFDGEVSLAYEPEGVRWSIRAPLDGLAARGRAGQLSPESPEALAGP